jgi:hypothetical protein
MSHVFTLALVYALVIEAARLLHAAAAGWAAGRRVLLEPLTLIAAAVAAAIGMAFAGNAVTAALGLAPASFTGPTTSGWLSAVILLALALVLHETHRLGRMWRAMGANAAGLVAIGVPMGLVLPTLFGAALAGVAGHLAPPPATTDWLPLACLALLVLGVPDRPKGGAVLTVLVAWFVGALVATLELLLGPPGHFLLIAAALVVAIRMITPRTLRRLTG